MPPVAAENATMYELTAGDVRAVLQHLSRDRTPRHTPLAELELVRRQLASSGFQPTPEACLYEIGHIMTQVVETELRRLRARHAGGSSEEPADGRTRVLADFRAADQDLECWSAVYHVYLRPDLRLDLQGLERLLADRHRRTIQRRLKTGTERLTARLQALERHADQASRRERLLARLPAAPTGAVVGAEVLARDVRLRLHHGRRHRMVGLGGPPGMGKTTVALAALRGAGRAEPSREPVWLSAEEADAAGSSAALAAEVGRRCGLPAGAASVIREAPCCAGRTVVIDGLDDMPTALRVASAADGLPPWYSVLLVGRVSWSGVPDVAAMSVPPLDTQSAVRLLRDECVRRGLALAAHARAEDLMPVVAAAGGHPMVLCTAAGELRLADGKAVAGYIEQAAGVFGLLVDRLWTRQWWSVDEPVRQLTELVLAAEARGRAPLRSDLAAACFGAPGGLDGALRGALDAGLVTPSGPVAERRYRGAPFLAAYVFRLADSLAAAPVAAQNAT
jgi:hypothetical protein